MNKRRASFVAFLVAVATGGGLLIASWVGHYAGNAINAYREQCKVEQSEDYDSRMSVCLWRK